MVSVARGMLPKGVKEGDILLVDRDSIKIDRSQTARRKEKIKKLMDELWK